jgi:hypothetical protein
MTTREEAVRAVQDWGGTKQNTIPWQTAMLGDGKGNVAQPGNMVYCRLTSNSSVIEVLNLRCAPIDGLLVRIAKTPEMPLVWQVIGQADQRADENGGGGGGVNYNMPEHHLSHEYLAYGQVNIDWRQITNLRVYAAGGFTVGILAGLLPRPGADLVVATQTLDLTAHIPSGAAWSLISVNPLGALAVTDGTPVAFVSLLTLADIPDTPAGNFRLAAVRLYTGQTAISESTARNDIRDLRWPQEYGALTPPLTNTHIFVGNASNVAVDVAMSSDATIANTGALTLKNTGPGATGPIGDATHVAATTIDAQGRVTALSSVAISLTPGGLAPASAANKILISGVSPFSYAESAGSVVLGAYDVTIPQTGTVAMLNAANIYTLGPQTMQPGADANQALIIKAHSATQSASLIQLKDASNNQIAYFTNKGALGVNPIDVGSDSAATLTGKSATVGASPMGFQAYAIKTNSTGISTGFLSVAQIDSYYNAITSAVLYAASLQCQFYGRTNNLTGAGGTGLMVLAPAIVHPDATTLSISGVQGVRIQNQGSAFAVSTIAIYIEAQSTSLYGNDNYGIYALGAASGSVFNHQLQVTGTTNVSQFSVTGYSTQTVGTAMAKLTRNDAAAGISSLLGLTGLGSGANNDGTSIDWYQKTSTTAATSAARLTVYMSNATHASLTTALALQNRTAAGALVTRALFDGPVITLTGSVGVNVTPTAQLHIAAGSATASTAPLKFTSGALLGTPEAGAMEFLDGRWYITGTAKQRVIDRTGGVIVANTTVSNTTTETTLWTEALSANAMKVGRIYKLHCDGICSNVANTDDLTLNLYFGGTLIGTLAPVTKTYTTAEWDLDVNVTIRTVGASGTMAVHGEMYIFDGNEGKFIALHSIDTTAANSMTLKAQWSAAKAGNTISIYQGSLELKN